MSYIYSEDDFDASGNFIASNGPGHFMAMLYENEVSSFNIARTGPQSGGDPNVFGGYTPAPLQANGINWEDPSLYTMPLSADELAAIHASTATSNPSPQSMAPSPHCTPSPVARTPSPVARTPSPGSVDGTLMSEPLRNANSSTWAARNPTRSTIHRRTPPPRVSDAQKASRKIKQDRKIELTNRLHDSIAEHLDEQKSKIEALALMHNVTPKRISDMISSQTNYRTSRKVQLTNALVHAKAKEMNAGQPVGSRYTLVELRKMVADDPQMKKLTKDEKAAYVGALAEHRDQKATSVRGNNMAASRDVLVTTERVVKELDDLRVRTGIYATVFVVRGHINDTTQSSMHGTDNSDDFWEDVYDLPMADFLRQYEQWACTQNQNLNERDSLEAVRKQVRKYIVRGLVAVTGKKDIAMNYNNYETAVIETYAVQLVGWPLGVKFISPSSIATVGEIRKLRDALKTRTCYWTALTVAEVKAHAAKLDARRSAGEVVQQPRKKRSDAGISRKRKVPPTVRHANKENSGLSKKVKRNAAQHREVPKSVEFIESSGEEEEEEEE